jgi:surface polysaccharide O-acyltransferase-like enzyme
MSNMVPKTPHTVNTIRRVIADKPCVTTSAQPISPVVAAAKTPREAGIEWLRIVACILVVAFHANTAQWGLASCGLEVFTVFTIMLAVGSAGRRGPADFIKTRAISLLVPWIFWWVVYAIWKSVMSSRAGNPMFSWFEPWRLFAGPEMHLWFMPFAFVATVATGLWMGSHPIEDNPSAARRSSLLWALAAGISTVVASYAMHALESLQERGEFIAQPWIQWVRVFPVILVGIAMVRGRVPGGYVRGLLPMLTIFMIIASGICLALDLKINAFQYAIAMVMCAIGFQVRHAASATLVAISTLTLGVFLIHPMVFDMWYFLAPRLHIDQAFPLGTQRQAIAMTAASVLLSALATWILRKTPLRRVV